VLLSAAIAGVSAVAGGVELYRVFFARVLPSEYFAGAYFRNQGFDGFFARLLTRNDYVHSLGNHPGAAHVAALIAGLAVLAATYFVLWRYGSGEPLRYDLGYGLCFAAALLFQAKSYEHHAVVLLFCFLFMFEAIVYYTPDRRWLLRSMCLSFAVWSFLLTLESEYLKLPRSAVMNLLFSAKFMATLVLWGCCAYWVVVTRLGAVPRTRAAKTLAASGQ
jgi:hypothetical protein